MPKNITATASAAKKAGISDISHTMPACEPLGTDHRHRQRGAEFLREGGGGEAYGHIAALAIRGDLVFPTSVNAALRVQLALDDPECPIDEAIRLVLAEPQLAARTVALANSAMFNRTGGPEVTNVRAAIMRIGYHNLFALAAAMVVRQFGSRITDPALRAKAEQLWQHTVHVACLARIIARDVTYTNPDTALFAAIVGALPPAFDVEKKTGSIRSKSFS
eukprot:gene40023-49487_t